METRGCTNSEPQRERAGQSLSLKTRRGISPVTARVNAGQTIGTRIDGDNEVGISCHHHDETDGTTMADIHRAGPDSGTSAMVDECI